MYTNHSIADCIKTASPIVKKGNAVVFQKFTCSSCGSRQTMDKANHFYTHGTCEDCGSVTDIEASGCNYTLFQANTPDARAHMVKQHGSDTTQLTFVDCRSWVAENPKVLRN